jgi:hypothetical protein
MLVHARPTGPRPARPEDKLLCRVSTRVGKAFAGWPVDGRDEPGQDEKMSLLFASEHWSGRNAPVP